MDNRLNEDVMLDIIALLDSEEDVARASTVCRSWHKLVVEGCLWKQICMRKFPDLKRFERFSHSSSSTSQVMERCSCRQLTEREKEHLFFCELYNWLARKGETKSCLLEALEASSTDNPSEHIRQTLHPNPRREFDIPSYWSSKGRAENVNETLTYRMLTPLCVVEQVMVRPFEAYFQRRQPIYSSKFVRFKFGKMNFPSSKEVDSPEYVSKMNFPSSKEVDSPEYVWNYVSPLFPMEQSDSVQTFSLPRPVVCIGGIFQVELVGGVQRQEMDNLFYICICHVSVLGRPLWMHDFSTKDESVLLELQEAHPDPAAAEPMDEDEDHGDELRRMLGAQGWYEGNDDDGDDGDVQIMEVQFE